MNSVSKLYMFGELSEKRILMEKHHLFVCSTLFLVSCPVLKSEMRTDAFLCFCK